MNTPLAEVIALLPCPFCGGPMQFRKALFVSDGCTDAIIHASPSVCGMVDFCQHTTDGSVITAWNTRATTPSMRDEGRDAAVEALRAVLPYVATQAVGCHGDKCREPWCYSCCGDEEAEAAAARGNEAYMAARAVLAALPLPAPGEGGAE